MNIQKYKKGKSENHLMLKNKLKIVDEHIRQTQNLPSTFFMHPELLQHLKKQKPEIQINNQIGLRQIKSFLFNTVSTARFYFIYQPISDQSRYCLKIQLSHTQLDVFVQVDDRRSSPYNLKFSKGIIIKETNWKKVQFILVARIQETLSSAKVQMDTIKIQHKVKVHGVPSQRKIAQQYMKQFLSNHSTKQKIDQIIQKRKQRARSQYLPKNSRVAGSSSSSKRSSIQNLHMHLHRNSSGFNQSTSLFRTVSPVSKHPQILSAQMMRDFNVFQDTKQKYLNHIKKMCPQKKIEINLQKNQYQRAKTQILQKLATTVKLLHFISKINKLQVIVSKINMKKIRKFMIVKKFLKHLMSSIKSKIPMKVRNNLSIDCTLSLIACIQFKQCKRKAEERILSILKTQFFKIDFEKICQKSQKLKKAILFLQRKYRRSMKIYKLRFDIITQAKKIQFDSQQQKQRCFKAYKKDCYKKAKSLKFIFARNHRYIDQIMKFQNRKKHRVPI